jgi:hypothetical protein
MPIVEAAFSLAAVPKYEEYYFDASDSGPTDPNNDWYNEPDAWDGSDLTDADGGPFRIVHNDGYGEMFAGGTNAPASGTTIQEVRLRFLGTDQIEPQTFQWYDCKTIVYSDAVELGRALNSQVLRDYNTNYWTNYTVLDAPAFGWTWAKIQALTCMAKISHASNQYQQRLAIVQLEVRSDDVLGQRSITTGISDDRHVSLSGYATVLGAGSQVVIASVAFHTGDLIPTGQYFFNADKDLLLDQVGDLLTPEGAYDGDTDTGATTNWGGSGFILGVGTSAPETAPHGTATISEVRVRNWWYEDQITLSAQWYDADANLRGSQSAPTGGSWPGEWVILTPPVSGWDWFYINYLQAGFTANGNGFSGQIAVRSAEVEVSYSDTNPPHATTDFDGIRLVPANPEVDFTLSGTTVLDIVGEAIGNQVKSGDYTISGVAVTSFAVDPHVLVSTAIRGKAIVYFRARPTFVGDVAQTLELTQTLSGTFRKFSTTGYISQALSFTQDLDGTYFPGSKTGSVEQTFSLDQAVTGEYDPGATAGAINQSLLISQLVTGAYTAGADAGNISQAFSILQSLSGTYTAGADTGEIVQELNFTQDLVGAYYPGTKSGNLVQVLNLVQGLTGTYSPGTDAGEINQMLYLSQQAVGKAHRTGDIDQTLRLEQSLRGKSRFARPMDGLRIYEHTDDILIWETPEEFNLLN